MTDANFTLVRFACAMPICGISLQFIGFPIKLRWTPAARKFAIAPIPEELNLTHPLSCPYPLSFNCALKIIGRFSMEVLEFRHTSHYLICWFTCANRSVKIHFSRVYKGGLSADLEDTHPDNAYAQYIVGFSSS